MTVTRSIDAQPMVSLLSPVPLDYPPSPSSTFTRAAIPMRLEGTTVTGLRRATGGIDANLFHALAAAYAWWLHLYADSPGVAFGCACDMSTVPTVVQVAVSADEPFNDLLGRIREVAAAALQDSAALPRSLVLFQSRAPADGRSLRPTDLDVSVECCELADGTVVAEFAYNADLLDRQTAREMASHWRRVLDAVAADPDIAMAEHDVVTVEDQQRQLSWNRTTREAGSPSCVHEVIDAQIDRTPDSVAVRVGATTLTYRQLGDRAREIASHLTAVGVGPGVVVALLLDRTTDVVAAILGVLRSGAAFLPLDPRQPVPRNVFCINDVDAAVVVTDRPRPFDANSVDAAVVDIDAIGPRRAAQGAAPLAASSTDLAYVICTSGSTGRPKPVLVEHRGATNLMQALRSEFGIAAGDTVLSVASISFDMALFDIFSALSCGAQVVLTTTAEAVNPIALQRLIASRGATYLFTTPTTWGALIAAGWAGDRRLMAAAGGETLSDGLAAAMLQRCGAVWNGYGPTEATAGASMSRLAPGDTVTVGRALPNVRVYVVDTRGRLLPIGVPGEIAIGGVGVGRGYRNRPEENAARFGDDPFHPGGRLYRTGDRGRFLPDGRLVHLGRFDEQLKIRGCRVEPGEIESTLCEHPEVGACAVIARQMPSGQTQLIAYVVGRLDAAETRMWLRHRLPEYMVPGAVVHLDALPMTVSGKLDKTALPLPSAQETLGPPPRTDIEMRVAAAWSDLLGRPVVEVHSDFFDLGGNSILAARLMSEVERSFGVALSLESFIDRGRTVAELAELLSAEKSLTTTDLEVNRPLHFIFSDSASAMSLRHFTTQWGAAQPVNALVPDQPGGRFDRLVTIEDHARQALSDIQRRQPDGPLALAGYSIGGWVAYEVARQARASGRQVEWLAIVDVVAPPMKRAQLKLGWRLRALSRRPAREQWAKYTDVALRTFTSRRRHQFDYRGVTEVGRRYREPGHQTALHLFATEASVAAAGDASLGWRGFHRGTVTECRLAGDHDGLLRLPDASILAQTMIESLCRARHSVTSPGFS